MALPAVILCVCLHLRIGCSGLKDLWPSGQHGRWFWRLVAILTSGVGLQNPRGQIGRSATGKDLVQERIEQRIVGFKFHLRIVTFVQCTLATVAWLAASGFSRRAQ